LGGYGPRGSDERVVDVLADATIDAGDRYDLSRSIPVIGIDATSAISGHSAISNDATYWMLYNLVMG
jgi:hypothetical protein